jgi:hypothetical protein
VAVALIVSVVLAGCGWAGWQVLSSVLARAEADAAFVRMVAERSLVPAEPVVPDLEQFGSELPVDWAGAPTYGIDPTDAAFPDPDPLDPRLRAVVIGVDEQPFIPEPDGDVSWP